MVPKFIPLLFLSAQLLYPALAPAAASAIPEKYVDLWNDAGLQEQMAQGIENHRKADVTLQILDPSGKPLRNAPVSVQQQTHEFLFGCNLFVLDQLSTPDLNTRYKTAFTNLFNFATVPFYWGDLEPEKGNPRYARNSPYVWRRPSPDHLVQWCKENGITPKGHAFMYVKNMFMPAWTARDNPDLLQKQCAEHIAEMAKRYGRDIPIWDVVNEEIPRKRHPNEWPVVFEDFVPWSFREAKRRLPKSAVLLINDGTNEAHDTPGEYEAIIESALHARAPIHGIGMQFHVYNRTGMMSGKSLTPAQLVSVYERFERLRLPLYITEVTVPGSGENGAAVQTAIVTNLYRLWFSTPNMAGVTWWNLGDGAAFQEENKMMGGLLDADMNPKPAYRALDELINREWKTKLDLQTDANGKVRFRGFKGKYAIKVSSHSASAEYPIAVTSESGKSIQKVRIR